jgi:wobble nucleotide-excising tRNase
VLSEGEKRLLALCHYLASSMAPLETCADVERLIFVVDDPVVALDAPHTKKACGVLARMGELLGIRSPRLLVLTHDESCFSHLGEMGATPARFVLEDGAVSHAIALH